MECPGPDSNRDASRLGILSLPDPACPSGPHRTLLCSNAPETTLRGAGAGHGFQPATGGFPLFLVPNHHSTHVVVRYRIVPTTILTSAMASAAVRPLPTISRACM
jgi:hypothetical protein